MVQRIIALDVGDKRIGVAVSCPLGITAQGVETWHRKAPKADFDKFIMLASAYNTDRFLLGLPKLLNGDIGPQGQKVIEFGKKLKELGYTVRYWDERLTTVAAEKILIQGNVRRENRKQYIDMIAASCILQGFLDAGGWIDVSNEVNNEVNDKENYNYTGKEVFKIMDGKMEQDNIVELVDENGKNVQFEHLITLEHNGEDYVLLVPVDEIDGVGEDEVVILKIGEDDKGEETYIGIEDEALLEEVFEKYLEIVENEDEE